MKKFTRAAILASAATLGIAGYAAADHHRGHGKGHMIEKLDTNGDGQIEKSEVEALKAERFEQADANGDGSLTMQELDSFREAERERRMQARKERMFDRRDGDGDGVISLAEFDDRGDRMFDRVDADDDGTITEEEIKAMKEKRGKRGWGRRGGDKDKSPSEE